MTPEHTHARTHTHTHTLQSELNPEFEAPAGAKPFRRSNVRFPAMTVNTPQLLHFILKAAVKHIGTFAVFTSS